MYSFIYISLRKQVCRPLDVPSLLTDSMKSQPVTGKLDPSSPVYWKLVISLPEDCKEHEFTGNDNNGQDISFIIKEKFKRGVCPPQDHIPLGLKKKVLKLMVHLCNY